MRRILVAFGVLALPAAAITMFYAGIGWDARIDTGQSLLIRELFPQLPGGLELDDAYERIYFTAEFYGILLPQLGDLLHALVTGSSSPLQLNNLATYRWQGIANLLIASGSAAALAVAVGIALRSRLAAAYTWAIIMLTPIFFGMSTMNIKDMPVAAGLSFVSAGLILSWTASTPSLRWVVSPILVCVGSCVTLATRPGLWPLLLAFFAGTLGAYALLARGHWVRSNWFASATSVACALPVSLAFLWFTNPFGRMALFRWLWDSYAVMRSYPWDGPIRTAGIDVLSTDLPWWYVPAWLLAQLPIASLILVGCGIFLSLWTLVRQRETALNKGVQAMAPVFIQALVLPTAIVLSGATLYDGIRHLLFMIPALLAVSSVSVVALQREVFKRGFHGALGSLASLVALAAVTLSAWAVVRWVPYTYAFINPVAGFNEDHRDWELDFWGLSAFEGVDRLKQQGLPLVGVLPTEETALLFGGGPIDKIAEASGDNPYGFYLFRRLDLSVGSCEPTFVIKRDRQVLGEGAICDDADEWATPRKDVP